MVHVIWQKKLLPGRECIMVNAHNYIQIHICCFLDTERMPLSFLQLEYPSISKTSPWTIHAYSLQGCYALAERYSTPVK